MRIAFTVICIALILPTYWQHASAADEAVAEKPATIVPAPRNANWIKKHEALNKRAKQGDYDLVFLGDSITEGWSFRSGKPVWDKYYGSRKALNLGISGDRTQHVLWRLDSGNIDGLHPKLVVLMIGTNNSRDDSAEDIAAGIKMIVGKLRERLPDAKILLLAIFPRDEKPDSPLRENNSDASDLASKVADDQSVFFLDINDQFLQEDGTLSRDVMPDRLHPNAKGYEIWAEAIEPKVAELLGEPAHAATSTPAMATP